MSEHNYSTAQLKELWARLYNDNPRYENIREIGGTYAFFALCTRLGDGTHADENGKAWLDVWSYIAKNHPGLLQRTPSPDNILKRGREVRDDKDEKGWIKIPVGYYWKAPIRPVLT